MGSVPAPSQPQISALPAEKLSKHFILDEIKGNIKNLHDSFPHVDLDVLLEQVTNVQDRKVDPEVPNLPFQDPVVTFHETDHSIDTSPPVLEGISRCVHIPRCFRSARCRYAEEGTGFH